MSHEAKGIGFIELVDFVEVAVRRVPNRLLGLGLGLIYLLRGCCGRGVSRVVCRRLIGGARASGEGGMVVAAAITVRGSGGWWLW